jgi:D-lactate dehydrogenase
MNHTAAFFEAFDEEERLLKKLLPKEMECFFTWKTIQEAALDEPPAPIVSVRTQSLIPIDWADGIDALITRSTGYDHITAYRAESGKEIKATFLPDYAGRAVAEQAMLLWTALLRKLEIQRASFDTFHRDGLTGRELVGRKLTVLGIGRIGSQIVDIATGLKMDVAGVDISAREIGGLKYVGLEKGVERAEILVCALPLTRETRGMLNYNLLRKMPQNAIFINIARGEISPAKDILALLKEKRLAAAALDVYDHEKELASVLRDGTHSAEIADQTARESVEAVLEMRTRSDVILTPHNAFNTRESVERKAMHTVENLMHYLEFGEFKTPVPYPN